MPPQVDCGASLVAFFPPEIYNFVGSSAVLPELLQSLDQGALSTVQFLQNGAVRVTFKSRQDCDRVLSAGIQFRGRPLRVVSADARNRVIHLRDCPAEVQDDVVRRFFSSFGEVHAISRSCHQAFPDIQDGNRVIRMTITKDVPGMVTVAGFECRVWYRRQPAFCAICRKLGHRSKACPLNGLCRRCRRPGHHARDCSSAWAPAADAAPGAARPPRAADASADAPAVHADAVPPRPAPAVDPVPPEGPPTPEDVAADQEAEMPDEEFVPSASAESDDPSEEDEDLASEDDALASGDEEVIVSAVSTSTSDSPHRRRKFRRCTGPPAVPDVLVDMDLSVEEGPCHKLRKTFRGVWDDKASWEEIRALKPRYRARTPKVPPSPASSTPSQTFSASSATPVPPASPAPSSVSSGGSVVGSVRLTSAQRRDNFRNSGFAEWR